MTSIGGIGAGRPGGSGAARRSGGGGFSLPGEARAASTGAAAAISAIAITPLPGNPTPPPDRDGRARRRASALLDGLTGLQRALLLGRDDPALLDRVAQLCDGEPAEDPELDSLLQDIVLRTRIELVRRGRLPQD